MGSGDQVERRDDRPGRARALPGRGAFVGREHELAELSAGLHDATAGRGGLFMIVGEPGIGKSRLADEIGADARDAGALVLWGRCWEGGGAPAYWPWVQVLRGCCDDAGDALTSRLGENAVHVAHLVPEIRHRLGDVPEPPSVETERARFHLFDGTTRFLKRTAAERPLVLILDDLHAADVPSLLLLEFLAHDVHDGSILVLGCYRGLEMRRRQELAAVVGDVARHAHNVPLRGLREHEVARFIVGSFGVAPASRVVSAVHRATDGNPFFVVEVARLLAVEGRLTQSFDRLGIPDGVREAIRQRLAPLSTACAGMLAVAAVVGRDFELAATEHACDIPAAQVLEAIDEAAAAEIIEPIEHLIGGYRFAHALIRETLYDDLPSRRRIELHRAVGRALEQRYGCDREPHLAELAHHFLAAAPGGEALPALEYCERTAERAARLLAYEEAAVYYQHALDALAFAPPDDRRRCELLLALGEAHDRAGDLRTAQTTFGRAAAIAHELGDAEALARAALGSGGQWAEKFTSSVFEKSDVALLEAAHAALDGGDSVLRVKLLARLGLKLRYLGARDRSEWLSADAIEMARRLGDVSTVAYALIARHAFLLGPDHVEARLAIANEVLSIADASGSRELALRGYALRVLDHLQMTDIAGADRDLERYAALAIEVREPFDLWMSVMCTATQGLMQGRFVDGEKRSMEAISIAWRLPGQQSHEDNAGLSFTAQLFIARREVGGADEVLPILEYMRARYPTLSVMGGLLMALLLDRGRCAEAHGYFEELAANDFSTLPRDAVWTATCALLAEACFAFADGARATILYDLLRPYAAQNTSIASTGSLGAVARYLGILARTIGRRDDALAHFAAALTINARLGARPWLAHTQHDLATMLLADDEPSARARARELLGAADDTARELGMTRLVAIIQHALASERPEPVRCSAGLGRLPGTTLPQNILRREGEYWTLTFEGHVTRLRDAKGLHFLAQLLRHPGREFHVTDLTFITASPDRGGVLRPATAQDFAAEGLAVSGTSNGLAMIDTRAKAAYRARLAELRREVEDARASVDSGRVIRAQEELDFLTHELARSIGVGGRERCVGSAAERARLNVTRAIRTVLARIAAHHSSLGQHLDRTVKTGMFCCYAPDPRDSVSWVV